jgi:hypothetical protein
MATPSTSSLLSDAGAPRVQDASAFHTATPLADDTSSVMTIKGSSAGVSNSPAPVQSDSAIKVSETTTAASEIRPPTYEADRGVADLTQPDGEGERRAEDHEQGGAPDVDKGSHNVMGTHRFTLLDKETLQLLNGKKSGCEWHRSCTTLPHSSSFWLVAIRTVGIAADVSAWLPQSHRRSRRSYPSPRLPPRSAQCATNVSVLDPHCNATTATVSSESLCSHGAPAPCVWAVGVGRV